MKTTEEQIIKECWECESCLTLGDHIVHCSGEWEYKTERGMTEQSMLDVLSNYGR